MERCSPCSFAGPFSTHLFMWWARGIDCSVPWSFNLLHNDVWTPVTLELCLNPIWPYSRAWFLVLFCSKKNLFVAPYRSVQVVWVEWWILHVSEIYRLGWLVAWEKKFLYLYLVVHRGFLVLGLSCQQLDFRHGPSFFFSYSLSTRIPKLIASITPVSGCSRSCFRLDDARTGNVICKCATR